MSAPKLKAQLAAARSAVAAAGEAIERLRGEIEDLQAERAAVASAPLPLDQALDVLRKHLDHLAKAAGPDLAGIAHAAAIGARQSALLATPRDPLLLFAALARPLVEESLTAAVRWFYEGNQLTGMAPADRDARLAEIDQRIAALEFEEESTISEAEALGMNIPRRINVDPAIVLGLRE